MVAIDYIPLWAFVIGVLFISLVCVEIGFRFGRRLQEKNQKADTALGTIVAATLGLLAFLLAFTFNIAAGRFEERRQSVLNEANAIGTAYLRTDFLEQPARDQAKQLYRKYVDLRLHIRERPMEETLAKSQEIQQELWCNGTSKGATKAATPAYALYIAALNEVIDSHEKRVAAGIYGRVPDVIWVVLLALASMSMALVGYACGFTGSREWVSSVMLALCFTSVLYLVADLDRPGEGVISTNMRPLMDLQNCIGRP